MKKRIDHLLVLVLMAFSFQVWAQKPEPIYSFARSARSLAWFETQAKLWQTETIKNPTNAYAWYNYYRAIRNVHRLDKTSQQPFDERLKKEAEIVNKMQQAVPESYEYNLCKYLTGMNDLSYLPFLKKADELGRDRTEHLADMIAWKEMERDTQQRNFYAFKWFESEESSPGLLNYNYNVLMGLAPNALLITSGDNDTYPAWTLQAKGIRTDVLVLNSHLLSKESYCKKLEKELGFELLKKGEVYADTLVLQRIFEQQKRPVYLALTCGEEPLKRFQQNLYLAGLCYRYSAIPFDNIAELRKNFEQVYLLDYLQFNFARDIAFTWSKFANQNYLVPLMKLAEHYFTCMDWKSFQTCKKRIEFITADMDIATQKEVKTWLSQYLLKL